MMAGGDVAFGGGRHSARSGRGGNGDALPWRELRRLSQHLARLLGRPSLHRLLPPTNMPSGELHAFLGFKKSHKY